MGAHSPLCPLCKGGLRSTECARVRVRVHAGAALPSRSLGLQKGPPVSHHRVPPGSSVRPASGCASLSPVKAHKTPKGTAHVWGA